MCVCVRESKSESEWSGAGVAKKGLKRPVRLSVRHKVVTLINATNKDLSCCYLKIVIPRSNIASYSNEQADLIKQKNAYATLTSTTVDIVLLVVIIVIVVVDLAAVLWCALHLCVECRMWLTEWMTWWRASTHPQRLISIPSSRIFNVIILL